MYAVIKSGGKQYKVREGDTLRVEKIDVEEGGEISLDDILMVADGDDISVGTPIVAGATAVHVTAGIPNRSAWASNASAVK